MLQSATVLLRALEDSDLEFLYALENDPAIWSVSDTLAPISRYTLRQYLANSTADFHEVRQLRLIICSADNSQPVGVIDLFNFEPLHQRAGVGITVLAAERRRGYAQAALGLLLEYAGQHLRLHQLHCTISADNQASLLLFQAAGFREVGVRYEWLRTASGWEDAIEMQHIIKI
ncbi:GNAT family N-acetyltransferase [Hymenobacter crusticola]|uniref:GNAT family N-acetyltransferase n=1 Tax=Hymenobacter crusticola TaxID=1770526 RepID=A0A243WI54_9BACT|nr:GNAT family N-acetyltransferase [Hymenobacter crusticola]OUJ75232.1 GNAT family N-acetyltransferase [Hymenobacter crusticola]